jgi:hypothetical protein
VSAKERHANRVEERVGGGLRGDATLQLKWRTREVVPDARLTNARIESDVAAVE